MSLPRLPVFVALCLAATLVAPPPVGAQEAPQASVRLLSQPPWHDDDDKLGLKLRITNTGGQELEGFAVQTKIYSRIITRTELHESLDGPDGFELLLPLPVTFDNPLAPGDSEIVHIDTPMAELLGFQEEGVYPMTVTLLDGNLTTLLDSFTTGLVYYPQKVTKPLNFSLLVPLLAPPLRGPDGTFSDAGRLAETFGAEGSFSGLVDAAGRASADGARMGLAPSPRTVEELADIADGYRVSEDESVGREEELPASAEATLASLETMLGRPGVTPILSPYAAADLPTVTAELGADDLTRQLAEGRTVLTTTLESVDLDPRWLFAPGSRWDDAALESVVAQRHDLRTFFSAESFETPIDDSVAGCPELAPAGSFTCPVSVENPVEGAATPGLVRDPDVQDRLAALTRPGGNVLDLQLFFTETAFIHLENPDLRNRVLQATIPGSWEPTPAQARRLFAGLTTAPWLEMLTPNEALGAPGVEPRSRQVVERAPALEGTPDPSYFAQVGEAEDQLNLYAELGPPTERLERLRRNLLTAESREWWTDEVAQSVGRSYIDETIEEIDRELAKVRVDALDTTLTSRRSPVQLFLVNEADYPVTVDVALEESTGEIRVAGDDLDELRDLNVGPGQQVDINVEVIAESSGIFGVSASVVTPESGEEIYSENIRVRSTNFNVIALGITFGALAFLVLFYVIRLFRRKRAGHPESAPA